jgi:phosphate starvation-inducible protein PhoH
VHGFPQSRQATEERSRLRKAYHKRKPRSHRGTETGSKEARREKRQEAKETEDAEENIGEQRVRLETKGRDKSQRTPMEMLKDPKLSFADGQGGTPESEIKIMGRVR